MNRHNITFDRYSVWKHDGQWVLTIEGHGTGVRPDRDAFSDHLIRQRS